MAARISKLNRWLDLIAFLSGRRYPVTIDEVMEGVPAYAARWSTAGERDRASARRAFERDKDELRRLGIPLRTRRYTDSATGEPFEGYLLPDRDFYLPYLRLVKDAAEPVRREPGPDLYALPDEDAEAALEALRLARDLPGFPLAQEAASAHRKLSFDLDPHASSRDVPILFADPPGTDELLEALRRLSDALLARKRVTFRYRGIYRDEVTERDVAPWGLFFQHGHWYLVGHDALRDDGRVFRVGRMEEVTPNPRSPKKPDYEVPPDFDLAAYLGRRAWELGDPAEEPLDARVLFPFPRSLWAARNRLGESVETRPDGADVRAFRVHQADPFLRWLLGLEGEVEVLSPPELRAGLTAMARQVAALYDDEDEPGGERPDDPPPGAGPGRRGGTRG